MIKILVMNKVMNKMQKLKEMPEFWISGTSKCKSNKIKLWK